MDGRLLKYFLSVYDNQGISAAAEVQNISQPALTKSIQKLEAEIGVQLFERRPSGVVATKYADILARRARLIDVEYRSAIAEISAVSGGAKGLIRIGAGPVWYSNLLPDIIHDYMQAWPDMRIDVQSGVINTLIPGLEAGKFDLVCSSLDFPTQPGITRERIINLKHDIIASEDHPLAGEKLAEPAELARYPWIVLANDHVGSARIWSYFSAFGCKPQHIAIETSSPTLMFEMICKGPYLAHIPKPMNERASQFGIAPLVVRGPFWETPAGISYRQSKSQPPSLQRLIKAIRKGIIP